MTRRKQVAAVASLLLAAAALWVAGTYPLPLRHGDRMEAARHVAGWVLEGKRLPGCRKDHPRSEAMQAMKAVVVGCDSLPPGTRLSHDRRLEGSKREEDLAAQLLDQIRSSRQLTHTGYVLPDSQTGYVVLGLGRARSRRLTVSVGVWTGSFGPGFLVVFRRTLFGLTADVKPMPRVMHSSSALEGLS